MTKRNNLTKKERYDLLQSQNWRCAICGERLNYSKKHNFGNSVAHIDHIHPISKAESYDGYINEMKNHQGLCSRCNLLKSDKTQYYCPKCESPLEVGTFNVDEGYEDYSSYDVEIVYICNTCDNFFPEYEVIKDKPKP